MQRQLVGGDVVVSILLNDNDSAAYHGRGPTKEITIDYAYLQNPQNVNFELFSVTDKKIVLQSLGKSVGGRWVASDHLSAEQRKASFDRFIYPETDDLVEEGFVDLTHYGMLCVKLDTFLDKDRVVKFKHTTKQAFNVPEDASKPAEPVLPYIYLLSVR